MVRVLPFLLGVVCVTWLVPTHAQERIVTKTSSGFAPQAAITLKKATALAKEQVGGRVLAAKPYRRGNTSGFQVRLLVDDERVVNVIVDTEGRVKHKK